MYRLGDGLPLMPNLRDHQKTPQGYLGHSFYHWCQTWGLWGLLLAAACPVRSGEFHVTFAPAVTDGGAFSGRALVMLTRQPGREPRLGPDWFQPEPFFARVFRSIQPGTALVFGADALGFPRPPRELPPGAYFAQAVLDRDLGERHVGTAAGNGYSRVVPITWNPRYGTRISLHIDQVAMPRFFQETHRVKLVEVTSSLLTKFHGRPTKLRAGLVLPASYATAPERRYPVVYEIPGFGGRHFDLHQIANHNRTEVAGVEMLYVLLDPDCRLGHHVFANSENNGPWGQALVEEFIPHLEKNWRALPLPGARYLMGHSSGGWSSLWLQITYANFFGGTWATAPDAVCFRAFQTLDIYSPDANLFYDPAGRPRPLGRRNQQAILFAKPFCDMEHVLGRGGQMESFEAVFSPRGPDGNPVKLWDRKTGAIDPRVAKTWEAYDIRLVLERNWATLGPLLRGKIHVYMGAQDTFYLEKATIRLKETLQRLQGDAEVKIYANRDHSNLLTPSLRAHIARGMAEKARQLLSAPHSTFPQP